MKDGINSDVLMKMLSDDAKIMLGGYFGVLGKPYKSSLQFGMQESRPTERAQTALDELVVAGALTRERLGQSGVKYVVQINCGDFGRWAARNRQKGEWPATEPIQKNAAPGATHPSQGTLHD